jgi:general secretion pathway protein C
MRLSLDPRARRLLRRLPHTTAYSALELALLTLLAVQCARLVWTIATPVGPIGEWQASSALQRVQPASTELLGSFDPFFRLSATAGPAVVTSLNLKLFGVREDRATGRGSAIVATPDGTQRSFAVGEEIMPGVTLTAVGFDNVTISRGGTREQLFLDQSSAATPVGGTQAAAPAPGLVAPAPPAPPPIVRTAPTPPAAPGNEISFEARTSNGRFMGVAVRPQGSGNAFRAAGLAPGDVILSVNGVPVTSADQARALAGSLGTGPASLMVDRGGRQVPIQVKGRQ